jgi:hypothetical protein
MIEDREDCASQRNHSEADASPVGASHCTVIGAIKRCTTSRWRSMHGALPGFVVGVAGI